MTTPSMLFIKSSNGPKFLHRLLSTTQSCGSSSKVNLFELNFDRRIKVDYKDSINYLKSQAYQKTYGDNKVWQLYRRNHKGPIAPKNTRLSCINDEGFVATSYPCPICRDEYLVLHEDNTDLLIQFINHYTGKIMTTQECHLCVRQYRNLMISIILAKDKGNLPMPVPNRLYNYDDYKA